MIDLNFLYCFSNLDNSRKNVTGNQYLSAQAFVKEKKQSLGRYYEGVISERIYDCIDNPSRNLNAIDIFILMLEDFGISIEDFIDELKEMKLTENNAVDKVLYSLQPRLRIFSSFNEIRARGNMAYFKNVKTDEGLSYREASSVDVLFKQPIVKFGFDWLKDMLEKLVGEDEESLSAVRIATLCAVVALSEGNVLDDDNLPKFILDKHSAIIKNLNNYRDSANIEKSLEYRNELYVDLFNFYFSRNGWDLEDNFLDGIVRISERNSEIYDFDKNNAKMMGVPSLLSTIDKVKQKETKFNKNFVITKEKCETFKEEIVGQEMAKNAIVDKLVSVACGFYSKDKPIATFLLNGPTGVGKTQTAKSIAKYFFDNQIYTVDMTNFKHESDIAILIGSAPGYVGYDDPNRFAEFIKKHPKCVLLFDEIDKASSSCLPFMMRLLDEGKFTTAKGDEIDVTNCVIIATTNQSANIRTDSINSKLDELTSHSGKSGSPFLKEFMGRFDEILDYEALSSEELKQILRQKLDKKIEDFQKQSNSNLKIGYGEDLLDDILVSANAMSTGARALNLGIQNLFIKPLSYQILENGNSCSAIVVDSANRVIVDSKPIESKAKRPQAKKVRRYDDPVYFG